MGNDLLAVYASPTFNDLEKNYSTIEKQLLAIVSATKYFRLYLFEKKINIITDHKPLEWLFSLKNPNFKLLRWRIILEEYNYKIIYKKDKFNTNSSALYQIPLYTKKTINIFKYMDEFILILMEKKYHEGRSNYRGILD